MVTVRNKFQRSRFGINFKDEKPRTKQSMKNDCDINLIMAKFAKTGTVAHLAKHGGHYGFCPSETYQEMIAIVAKAQEMFADLPSKIRTKFDNDPAKFLAFVQDDKNLAEMRELGLAEPAQNTPPATTPAPPPAPPK